MTPWIFSLLSVAGCLVLLAFLGVALFALYAAWRTYRPARALLSRTPDALGLDYTPVRFPAADGRVTLSGWILPASLSTRRRHTIVVCHQWGAHKAFALPQVEAYCKAGFDVIAFDLRNHGESQSDHGITAMSRRFTDDVRGVVAAARALPQLVGNRVTVHAFSFSTFPAVVAAAQPIPGSEIDALVLDSGPTRTTNDIIAGFFDTLGVKLLPGVIGFVGVRSLFRALYTRFALWMLATDWPSDRIRACPAPMLFICGGKDTVSSPRAVEAAASMFARAKVALIPGAKHLAGMRQAPQDYITAILAFHEESFVADADRRID